MASSTMSEPTPTVAATATATQRPSPAATVSLRTAPAGDSAVQAIIAAARRPVAAPAWGALLCGAAFGLLWYLSFFPADLGPLAFLAPVPLLLLVRLERPTRWMYTAIYVTQLAAMLVAIYWLAANEHMVPAWIALSLYLSLFTPVFVLATRTATRRLRLPLVVAAPLVWTGLEFVRAHLLTGFAWYYVAHTQWKWTTLIQISDITGAYGVSFVVLTCAAATALCVPDRVLLRLRLLPGGRWRSGTAAQRLSAVAGAVGGGRSGIADGDAGVWRRPHVGRARDAGAACGLWCKGTFPRNCRKSITRPMFTPCTIA